MTHAPELSRSAASHALLLERLAVGIHILPDKAQETPELTLRALWLAAKGFPVSEHQDGSTAELPPLEAGELAVLEGLVAQRIAGVPLAHLTGRQRFMGLEMLAGPDALIPRKDTELLARTAIRLGRQGAARSPAPLVLDVCTGSGNVALAIAHQITEARVLGADMSPEAIALACRNAAHLGLAHRVEFRCGDLLAPFETAEFLAQVDVLTCNPPYITRAKLETMPAEIARHEPRLAFDGGVFGLDVVLRLIQHAPRFLKTGAWLVFEVGAGQGPGLVKRMRTSSAFAEVTPVEDEGGAIRAIMAQHGNSTS